MRRSFRWLVASCAGAGAFTLAWWCCEALLGLSRGDALGIAAIPSSLIAAPLGWWAGRERPGTGPDEKTPLTRDWPLAESVDPLVLGVHKARPEEGFEVLPGYIPRDADTQLRAALRTAAEHGGFILLTGGSAAGKSRTAFAAIQSALGGYRVVSPIPGSDLPQLFAALDNNSAGRILWLDDLEGHLGSHGLQLDLLNHLMDHKVVIVATMRDEQYERFRLHRARKASNDEDNRVQREIYLGAQVLNLATCIEIPRKWSKSEIERAGSSEDPRLHEALQRPDLYAIPEYVAAGPQLLQEWKQAVQAGGHPRGAALVAAAIDLNRAGLGGAIPATALIELHHRYLDEYGGNLLRPESLPEAMTWASTVRYGITSLLLPAGKDTWRAFDYLVDSSARDPQHVAVPAEVWRAAIQYARTPRELHDVGVSAIKSQHLEIAEEALHAAADQDDVQAMVNLGALLANRGAAEDAEFWTRKGADAGYPAGIFNLAVILAEKGAIDEAKSLYAKACDAGNSDAAVNLGNIHYDEGDSEKAVTLYRRAATMGNPAGLLNLGYYYRDKGDHERYEQYIRQACDSGHPMAMNALGVLLMRRGLPQKAEHWLRKAARSHLTIAQVNLGLFLEEKANYEEAESCYRDAAERGDARGSLRLGDLLCTLGQFGDGKERWREAASAGLDEAAARRLVEVDEPNGLSWIITDERTTRELAGDRIHEVCRNLWPVDCQTCGKPFEGRTPSLNMHDAITHGYASLHHVTCLAPAWVENFHVAVDGNLSWGTLCFSSEIAFDGAVQQVPILLVNPGLEQVYLTTSPDNSWRASTVKQFDIFDFKPSNSAWATAAYREMPVTARLSRREIAVTVYPGTTWTGPIDNAVYRLARRLGGTYVFVTTRILPASPIAGGKLAAELAAGNIAVRWFPFDA